MAESEPTAGADASTEAFARRLPGFLQVLAYRDFRLLWIGAFLSSIGTWTQDVALSWLIHKGIGNPVYLGLRSFAQEAPLLTFMLIGGAVADRIDRRRILLTSNFLQMAFAVVLFALFAIDRLGVAAILTIAFLTGLAQSQSAPTYQAVLTTIVPPARIPGAVALNSLQFNLSRAIGPAIAALLLARAGTGVCFLVNAVSFVAVIVALARLRMPFVAGKSQGSLRESLLVGLRHVARDPVIGVLMLLAGTASFLAFPLITYMPVIADNVLGMGAAGFSLLLSSYGAGAILGAITTAQRGNRPGRGRLLLYALGAYAVATIAALVSPIPAFTMALLFMSGASLVTAFSTLNSLVQELAPNELRGRVVSIYSLAFRGGSPLGSVAAGFLIAPLGAPIVLGSFSTLLLVIVIAVRLRGGRVPAL